MEGTPKFWICGIKMVFVKNVDIYSENAFQSHVAKKAIIQIEFFIAVSHLKLRRMK